MEATFHSPAFPNRPVAARTRPKLRDSCNACSSSKVKCNREKPTCARCARRGLQCEYLVARRAGRKHDSTRTRSDATNRRHQPQLGTSWSPSPGAGNMPGIHHLQHSPRQRTPEHWGFISHLRSDSDSVPSLTTGLNVDFDSFIASPISFPAPDLLDPEILVAPSKDTELLDLCGATTLPSVEDAFSIPEDAVSDFAHQPTDTYTPRNSGESTSNENTEDDSLCCCLVRALGLLRKQCPRGSRTCTRTRVQDNVRPLPTTQSIVQSIVVDNARTIEAIANMLQCSCAHDCFLLVIMSLIVLNVLGWYAAAARGTLAAPDTQQRPPSFDNHCSPSRSEQIQPVLGSYCIDGEDQWRMTAQLVLSELHRVQRLVTDLSIRLKGTGTDGTTIPNSPQDGVDSLFTSSPSSTMLNQLEIDLRKRLRALSLEIVDILRLG